MVASVVLSNEDDDDDNDDDFDDDDDDKVMHSDVLNCKPEIPGKTIFSSNLRDETSLRSP